MSNFSLYQRFRVEGTLSEPDGIPDPRFALPSTVHWMQALRMLIEDTKLTYSSARIKYAAVQRAKLTSQAENTILEHLLLSLHQVSALRELASAKGQADIARVASVAWYYGIYDAATAMVAAQSGNLQDNHTQTARSWDNQFAKRGEAIYPFDFRLSTLVEKEAESELSAYRRIGRTTLVEPPLSLDKAHDYACAYLTGSRSWWAWKAKEDLIRTPEFRELNVTDFRTKAARSLRDKRLSGQAISFLHLAFRYRGKANYREALFLAHGTSVKPTIKNFPSDLCVVLEGFLAMAGAFAERRLGKELWSDFMNDVEAYRSFNTSPKDVWS